MSARIYFATNRTVLDEDKALFGNVGAAGNPPPYQFRVGAMTVERKGSPWADGDAAYRITARAVYNDRVSSGPSEGTPGSAFMFREIGETLRETPSDIIILIHGFASSMDNAIRRGAEIRDAYVSPDPAGGKNPVKPIVIVFSWPSDGVVIGAAKTTGQADASFSYASDRDDARLAGHAIGRFLSRASSVLTSLAADVKSPTPPRLHIVAHSMGVWALRGAVQKLLEMTEEEGAPMRRAFENAFLMAGDISHRALEREAWLKPLYGIAQRVHVYHAENDIAVAKSALLPNQDRRLGLSGPHNMSALPDATTAIDCSAISETPGDVALIVGIRHQYYRLAPEAIADVRAVLSGETPDRIANRTPTGPGRWRLAVDRPAREALKGKPLKGETLIAGKTKKSKKTVA